MKNLKVDLAQQRQELDTLKRLNELYAQQRSDDARLSARIASFELAYRMQSEAPEAFDLKNRSEATNKMYGIDRARTAIFGKQCLLARRLVERGVRFVQLYHTTGGFQSWDQHGDLSVGTHCAWDSGLRNRLTTRFEQRKSNSEIAI